MAPHPDSVFEFRVELRGINPPIWRRIQLPASSTFWDLHCAIQDAMGWLDSHLHAFVLDDPQTGDEEWAGLPDPDDLESGKAGWDVKVRDHFASPGDTVEYLYDFGDGWEHDVTLQKVLPREPEGRYPRCVAGKRACPPEDCGGPWGYQDLLEGDPDLVEAFPGFDPEEFRVEEVFFEDADQRRKEVERWFRL